MIRHLLAESFTVDPVYAVMILAAILVIVLIVLAIALAKMCVRCPSNRILVIYGATGPERGFRCLHGGVAFVLPLLRNYAFLALEPHRVTISARPILKSDTVEMRAPQIFNVAIGTTPELMQNAAVRLLGLDRHEVKLQAEDVIVSELDGLIAQIEQGDVELDEQRFYTDLQSSVEAKLNELGLTMINFRRE